MSLFNRVRNYLKGQTIKASEFTEELDNIINNMTPQYIEDQSSNVAAMQAETDPGSQGSENLPASLQEEIQALRFAIRRVLGETYWYDTPDISISSLNSLVSAGLVFPKNRIESGRVNANGQPAFLTINGNAVRLNCSSTTFKAYINNTLVEQSTNIDSAALTGPSSFTTLVNESSLAGGQDSKVRGEYGTTIPVDTPTGTAPSTGSFQAWKLVNGSTETEYFIARYASSTALDKARRGAFFDSSELYVPRIEMANNETITLCRLAYVFFKYSGGTATLEITYNQPSVSFDQPSSPSTDDYWLDLNEGIWKRYDGSSWSDDEALPVGVALVDGSTLVGVRSADFGNAFDRLNTIEVEKADAATINAVDLHSKINVYGSVFAYDWDRAVWDMASDLDSGLTEEADTRYYLYITKNGQTVISDVRPYDRRQDLQGYYHPAKPWRCVGFVDNDSSSNLEDPQRVDQWVTADIQDQAITPEKMAAARKSTLSQETGVNSDTSAETQLLGTSFADLDNSKFGTTFTVNPGNRPVAIRVGVYFDSTNSNSETATLQLLRGSTVIRTWSLLVDNGGSAGTGKVEDFIIDEPGADENVTYKLQAKRGSTYSGIFVLSLGGSLPLTAFNLRVRQQVTDTPSATNGVRFLEGVVLG